MKTRYYLDGKEISESVANAIEALNKEYIASGDFELMAKCQFIVKIEEKEETKPETEEKEVEISEGDIKWIGDNIFHLVYEELIKTKGNTEHITLKFLSPEFIKFGWDNKSKFILSYKRVYPLDAVEKYLSKDGRTIKGIFEDWKIIAIEAYNE